MRMLNRFSLSLPTFPQLLLGSKMSKLLCFVFFLSICSHLVSSSSFTFFNSTKMCSHHQSRALLRLKQSFSINSSSSSVCDIDGVPSYPKTESWKKGSDCCLWDGVICDLVTGHVIELDLSCSWLFGTIHSNTSLFLLPHLQSLNLAFNNFTGSSVSDAFGRFPSLTHLNLSGSVFLGLIPPEISHLSNLVSLDLSWNFGAEFAPHGFDSLVQNLTKLQKLHLGGIFISSNFPISFLNRSSLISLELFDCGLYGRFPDYDIHLPKLEALNLLGNHDLSGNFPRFSENNSLIELVLALTNFSGELPALIGNLKSLQTLDLANCGFSGYVPASIGNLNSLKTLDFSHSGLSGFIPPSIGNLKSLQTLDLSNCGFSGSILASIGNLKSLETLFLTNCGFSGSIPASIGNLKSLKNLDLSYCGFSGSIPASIGNLKPLQILDLSNCAFSGSIPASIGNLKSLKTLDLSGCGFSGSIPTSLGNLTQITSLDTSGNHFSGRIPNVFHNLPNLTFLDLSSNNFSGQLPPSVGNLTNLRVLDFSNNQLEGIIPCHVNGFSSLYSFRLGYNLLNGTIPSWLYTLPSLELLFLQHNKLSGYISEFQSESLQYIDLSMNELHGPIPSSLFKLVNLIYLSLSSNNLSGIVETIKFEKLRNLGLLDLSNNTLMLTASANSNSILPNIGRIDLSNNNISGIWAWNVGTDTLQYLNLSFNSISRFEMIPWKSMKILDLQSNLLQGPLPIPPNSTFFYSVSRNKLSGEVSPLICKVKSMGVLDLSSNDLSGMLPHCLGNFSKDLHVLNLQRNQFYGGIPQTFLKGNVIRSMYFSSNQLEGPMPRSLIICRELEALDLGNNKMNDTFPHWLGTLPKLQVLVLRSNNFHGHIGFTKIKSPFISLRILDISHNDFKGELPEMYLRSLKAIMNVDEGNITRKYMGDYYYQDSITVTIKGLEIEFVKVLNTFTTIDLSSNKFQAEIPKSIGNLNSLRGLNLSYNNIIGHIPSSFGNLKLLESLDLSSNMLIGRIPQELTSLTFLEVLNLSQNHLTGVIPHGNQFDTFENDSYIGNPGLCGFPLSKKCTTNEALETSKEADVKIESGFDWKIVLIGYGCGLVIGLSLGCLIFSTRKPKWFVQIVEENILRTKRSTRNRRARRN